MFLSVKLWPNCYATVTSLLWSGLLPRMRWPIVEDRPHAPHADLDPPASPDGWLDLGPGWLFASIRDAVIVADAETGRIALWNPAATQLLGFASEEASACPWAS